MIRDREVRQPGKYDVDKVSEDNGLRCEDPSLTVQSEKEDADINTIVRRFGLTGQLPQGLRPPSFEDFTEVFDFRSAVEAIGAAEEAFMALPAEVRARFDNSPQEFVAFCSEEKDGKLANVAEMRKMGLAVPEVVPAPPPEPMRVRVVKDDDDGEA